MYLAYWIYKMNKVKKTASQLISILCNTLFQLDTDNNEAIARKLVKELEYTDYDVYEEIMNALYKTLDLDPDVHTEEDLIQELVTNYKKL